MKKVLIAIAVLAAVACKKESKGYLVFKGEVTNKNSDSLFIFNRNNFKQTVKVAEDGTFNDTIRVTEKGIYNFMDGKEIGYIFLENDIDVSLSFDAENISKTIKVEDNSDVNNQFIVKNSHMEQELMDLDKLSLLTKKEFAPKIMGVQKTFNDFYNKSNDVDSTLLANSKSDLPLSLSFLISKVQEKRQLKNTLPKGALSPLFENYISIDNEKVSLTDFKGKYVFIDLWASWCKPCLNESKSFNKLTKDYENKNIVFVGISIDNPNTAVDKWKKAIEEEKLLGYQLLANNSWESDFTKRYQVNSIPRYILVDPEGRIINSDTPRPSDPELITLFNSLGL